jgi:UDP-N-acetylmuramoyl-tripeptide--D-alanyl-D-alanine ligase
MTPLWSVAEVLAATGGRPVGLGDGAITAISIDSRELPKGALFIAIKGDTHDGHDFVAKAIEDGAAAALVSEEYFARVGGAWLIVVPDPLEALNRLAEAARARSRARIAAVTGSAGKTTTKEAIRVVFEALGETHASIRSFNNHWGVPLMLARLPREARYAVFEIGMNHAGEITPLVKLVRPHVAVITTVAAAHLEFFNSISEIAEAKAEIFRGIEPGGVAVLNADHAYLHILLSRARAAGVSRVVTYGFEESADWRIDRYAETLEGADLQIAHEGGRFALALKVKGRHMAANALCALIVGRSLGGEPGAVSAALADFGAPEGRGLTQRLGPGTRPLLLVDESYNANTASMRAALELFHGVKAPDGNKVLILGDMLELGPQSESLHVALADSVAAAGAGAIHLVGPHMAALAAALTGKKGLKARVTHYGDAAQLAETLSSALAYGDAVMVKGSNGIRLGQIVKLIRERFR